MSRVDDWNKLPPSQKKVAASRDQGPPDPQTPSPRGIIWPWLEIRGHFKRLVKLYADDALKSVLCLMAHDFYNVIN